MVAARDIANEIKKAKAPVKKMVRDAVNHATNGELPADAVDDYAEVITELSAKQVAAEYQDQEDEWTDVAPQMVPFGQEQSEARGILKDMHAEADLGLASRTVLTGDDQASAMMELRVMHKHYPAFGFDYIVKCLEASRVSISAKGRNQDTEILKGNVPLQQPNNDLNRPRTW